MATGEADEPIILSTRRAARELALTLSVIAAMWVALVLSGPTLGMRTASPHSTIVAVVGVPLIMASTFPLLALAEQFGRTVIDDRGVTDKRIFRRPRRLDWNDVRRVRWLGRTAALQGNRATVTIAWEHAHGAGNDRRARERVRRHLQPHFDLSDPPPPRARAWTWLSTWRVTMLALVLSGVVYLVYRQILANLANPAQARLWTLLLIVLLLVGCVWGTALALLRVYRDPDCPGRWRTRLT